MSPSIDLRENRPFAEEMKFVVAKPLGDRIRDWARVHLSPDPNADGASGDEYRITSIYFDTPEFDVLRRRESYGRSKYRIRRYGASDQVFLERKLKTHGLVTKRRSLIDAGQLAKLGNGEAERAWRGFWYQQRLALRKLRPVCQIVYDRTARVTMTEHGPIRLTIDQNVEAMPLNEIIFQNRAGQPMSTQHFIVELKFRAMLPPLFKSLIQEFALTPAAMSKYRMAVAQLGIVPPNLLPPAEASPMAAYA